MINPNLDLHKPLIRIVEDDANMRTSLQFMLVQEGFQAISFESAEDFLCNDIPSVPGCLLLDVRMGQMSGLELQERLIARGNKIPIVFLSAHGDIDMAVDTMQKGAVAFIQKTEDRTRLMQAIYIALENTMQSDLSPAQEVANWNTLTQREKEVANLIAQGLLNKEVAQRLNGIAVKTVQVHRGEVCRKLNVKGAAGITQAVRRVTRILEEAPL